MIAREKNSVIKAKLRPIVHLQYSPKAVRKVRECGKTAFEKQCESAFNVHNSKEMVSSLAAKRKLAGHR